MTEHLAIDSGGYLYVTEHLAIDSGGYLYD